MGLNISLIGEEELVHETYGDFGLENNVSICLWQQKDKNGNVYDVSGSEQRLVRNYFRVYFDNDGHVSKFSSGKTILNCHYFTNVRKSTIIRKYIRNYSQDLNKTYSNLIIGDYKGKSYDISLIYPEQVSVGFL